MTATGDVFYSGRWWDVDDEARLLRCSDCGEGVWGDGARANHECEDDEADAAKLLSYVEQLAAGQPI